MENSKWIDNLLAQIDYSLKKSGEAISELEYQFFAPYEKSRFGDDEIEHQNELLEYFISEIHIKLLFAFEYLGLNKLRLLYKKEFKEYESSLSKIKLDNYGDFGYSPVLEVMHKYISTLRSFSESGVGYNSQILLQRILKGTPKIVQDYKVAPSNEADVKRVIHNYLIHTFPDTVPETSISKVTKCYKPDFGIKSLKAAIEYKFVDSVTEAKRVLGEIYEDVHGYEGDANWELFYAVIYMTKHFFTEDQIAAEFDMSKVTNKWFPILVYGKGRRKRKKKT